MWEQGLAEVAKYDAQRTIYGKVRSFEYTLIAVKETFNEEHRVKTDDYNRDDLYDVMKVNKICAYSLPINYSVSLHDERILSARSLRQWYTSWSIARKSGVVSPDQAFFASGQAVQV